MTQIGRMAGSV